MEQILSWETMMVKNLMYPSNASPPHSEKTFNPARLTFARIRRGLKKTELAQRIEVTPRSVTGYESGEFPPDEENILRISTELNFPVDFFFLDESIELLDSDAVSFRALSKMSASLRNIALSSGALALGINEWIDQKFDLPTANLPDFGHSMSPEAAAEALRHFWGLGESSIRNMVHLLEAQGVRVFSLAIDANEVDAFSLWQDGTPFVFLNTQKSPEHSRFDAAHELGHLILHRHGQPSGQEAERAADAFASAFLMPAKTVLSSRLMFPSLDTLIRAKKIWGVSVAALNYRLHSLGLTTEWTNRSLCIQISKAGYRKSEPNSINRELSQVWEKLFSALKKEGLGKADIARDLCVAASDIDELTYGLLRLGAVPEREVFDTTSPSPNRERPKLFLVR
jgi:Zn-dependent peptidase ImmA (M78 family)/transcriptional regulator with XRE-family HTH domain